MNTKYTIAILFIVLLSCKNQIHGLKIDKKEINLGNVKHGDSINFDFNVINLSPDSAYSISSIKSSCDCVVPADTNFTLEPSITKLIKCSFIPKKTDSGLIEQIIGIRANDKNVFYTVHIKANVL